MDFSTQSMSSQSDALARAFDQFTTGFNNVSISTNHNDASSASANRLADYNDHGRNHAELLSSVLPVVLNNQTLDISSMAAVSASTVMMHEAVNNMTTEQLSDVNSINPHNSGLLPRGLAYKDGETVHNTTDFHTDIADSSDSSPAALTALYQASSNFDILSGIKENQNTPEAIATELDENQELTAHEERNNFNSRERIYGDNRDQNGYESISRVNYNL